MENETKKILSEKIKVSATCVRVPVITSHSESVNVEFEKNYNIDEVKKLLSETSGCKLVDEHVDGGYITPLEAQDDLKTYISRVRKDRSNEKAINMWIVSDNLLKGAALNSVQIAETLVKYDIKKIFMEYDKNPLTPHLQIYKWQISSLLSIAHRITGVINAIAISLICIWFLLTINNEKILFEKILNSFFGKFISISLCWTFSFHILNEIRHLIWDAGYGFDLKISKITGYATLILSFLLAIIIYFLGVSL